ncbi:MAG: hypothetical protein ABIF71_04670 [Planctomycetota bacterium]
MVPGIRFSDTPPVVDKIFIDGYRRMSPRQKMQCVSDMTNAVLQMALARIRKQHPGISEREERLRLASLWLDRETMIKVFQWDPYKEGY